MYFTSGKILATMLLVVLGAPLVCLALPADIAPGTMSGGCHGHHGPMPLPTHSCCYARPQAPAQIQITLLAAPVSVLADDATHISNNGLHLVIATHVQADSSPPPPSVLRI